MKSTPIQRLLSLFQPFGQTRDAAGSRSVPLDCVQLEDRVLYSASPLPAEFVDDLQHGVDHGMDQVFDHGVQHDIDPTPHGPAADAGWRDADAIDETPDFLPDIHEKSDVRTELVVIDSSVPDYQQLVADLVDNAGGTRIEILILNEAQDGIDQISERLADLTSVDAIHIVSHGSEGNVQLGNATLNEQSLSAYAGQLARWGSALDNDADLLLYGCNLAASESGRGLLETIGMLTGADVAAERRLDRT